MDLNGGRRRIPLVEEPKRPPWMVIILVIAGLVVAACAVSNVRLRLSEIENPFEGRFADRSSDVVEREVVEPGAPPRWVNHPEVRYPDEGFEAPGGEGRVTLDCGVRRGRLRECFIVDESPPGFGFGEAGLQATRRARVTETADPDARIRFSIRFLPPPE
jgi:hypothetical protein